MKGCGKQAMKIFDAWTFLGRTIAYPVTNADCGSSRAVDLTKTALDDSAGVGIRFPDSTTGSRRGFALYLGRKTINLIDDRLRQGRNGDVDRQGDWDGDQRRVNGQRLRLLSQGH